MSLRFKQTDIQGLVIVEPEVFKDSRGYLAETFHAEKYRQGGIDCSFVQDNQSFSTQGVLRGLHAQWKRPQAKLVRVLQGEIYDVAVDIRPESGTFGRWYADRLSDGNLRQIFIPAGFLHGFCVLSETAIVHYKCSTFYDAKDQVGVRWDDPFLAIPWPQPAPVVSEKDQRNISWDALKKMLESKG